MPNLSVATFYEDVHDGDAIAGRMDVARLPAWAHEEADVWLCGPELLDHLL
jgi:nitric oxide dioxygenase